MLSCQSALAVLPLRTRFPLGEKHDEGRRRTRSIREHEEIARFITKYFLAVLRFAGESCTSKSSLQCAGVRSSYTITVMTQRPSRRPECFAEITLLHICI